MAQVPALHRDEQYPLLNPDGGGDVKKHAPNPTTVVATEWNVTCTPKQSWCSRWPQYLSACWMTLVLLVISFFVFYALGVSIYRRQPIVVYKCNDSKPAGDMYYHYIVPKENALSFRTFSEYISYMAIRYSSLRFQIYFLIDDTTRTLFPKKSTLFNKFIPQVFEENNCHLDQNNLHDIQEFKRKYKNVDVSVLCLSKYMAKTPLKYKWKTIPINYLPFYARLYELWKNGGVALDLVIHNYRYNSLKRIDDKLNAILKQHNDGIKLNEYAQILDDLDNQDDNELIKTIFDVFSNIVYQTQNIFSSDLSTDKVLDNKRATIVHRSKRKSIDIEVNNNSSNNGHVENMKANHTASNFGDVQTMHEMLTVKNDTNTLNITQSVDKNISNVNSSSNDLQNGSVNMKETEVRSYLPQFPCSKVHFYDFSGFMDDTFFREMMKSDYDIHNSLRNKDKNTYKNYLTLNSDGNFIAASSRNHPFLVKLMYPICYQKLNPQIAIRDAFQKQCSRFIFNEAYCDSIRILYNL